jgi:hypothetical protein
MQLSAAQTSLEPHLTGWTKSSRRPFVSQSITEEDGSRFASQPDPVQRPRVAALRLPSQSQTSCRLCARRAQFRGERYARMTNCKDHPQV